MVNITKKESLTYTPPVPERSSDSGQATIPPSRHGLYRIYWKDGGGVSVAAVGSDAAGRRWLSPTNWISGHTFDWSAVERVEFIQDTSVTVTPTPTKNASYCKFCRDTAMFYLFILVVVFGLIPPYLLMRLSGWKDPEATFFFEIWLGFSIVIGVLLIPYRIRATDEYTRQNPHNFHR